MTAGVGWIYCDAAEQERLIRDALAEFAR